MGAKLVAVPVMLTNVTWMWESIKNFFYKSCHTLRKQFQQNKRHNKLTMYIKKKQQRIMYVNFIFVSYPVNKFIERCKFFYSILRFIERCKFFYSLLRFIKFSGAELPSLPSTWCFHHQQPSTSRFSLALTLPNQTHFRWRSSLRNFQATWWSEHLDTEKIKLDDYLRIGLKMETGFYRSSLHCIVQIKSCSNFCILVKIDNNWPIMGIKQSSG